MVSLKKIHTRWLTFVVSMIAVLAWVNTVHAVDIQKKLINFQGYLTDNSDPPVPFDGTFDITFRIYETPGSQTPTWTEQHTAATIVRGNTSVLLGSITDLNSFVFDEPRYLGIQVGTDPEMTPRQRLLPAFHATSADRLIVRHADETRSEFDAGRLVPIGLISPYFGDPAALPDNWKVCDGSTVNDSESPLNGKVLPDLTAKFIRGEVDTGKNTAYAFEAGGNDSHLHVSPAHSHNITINSVDGHNHSGVTENGGVQHTHTINCYTQFTDHQEHWHVCGDGNKDCADNFHDHPIYCSSGQASAYLHNHGFTTSTNGAHTHSATIANTEFNTELASNLPSYIALHYIIRIK